MKSKYHTLKIVTVFSLLLCSLIAVKVVFASISNPYWDKFPSFPYFDENNDGGLRLPGFYASTPVFNSSNDAFVAFADKNQGYRITVAKLTQYGWSYVGSPGFSTNDVAGNPSVGVDSNNDIYVAYQEVSGGLPVGEIVVKKYNGTNRT